jgi:steroid delta-isomerase-like uncharacterized protein
VVDGTGGAALPGRRGHVDRVVNGHDLNGVDELLAANFVEHHAAPGFAANKAGQREMFAALFTSFPDMRYDIEELIAEGDKVVLRGKGHGTHKGAFMGMPATNKTVNIDEIHIVSVENGKITAHWAVFDRLKMLQQLGVIPTQGH